VASKKRPRTTPVLGRRRTMDPKGQTNVTLNYSKLDGLVPAVAQDARTGEVLMVGFMNAEAFDVTRRTGYATFFSRSRGALWTKGETSGNRLAVVRMLVDCDEDTVVLLVNRQGDGNVCHTGERSCFYREIPLETRAQSTGGGA
jgi:phosphoribosyl-AMP cyclohydrolase